MNMYCILSLFNLKVGHNTCEHTNRCRMYTHILSRLTCTNIWCSQLRFMYWIGCNFGDFVEILQNMFLFLKSSFHNYFLVWNVYFNIVPNGCKQLESRDVVLTISDYIIHNFKFASNII